MYWQYLTNYVLYKCKVKQESEELKVKKIEIRIMYGEHGVYNSEHHSWQTDMEQCAEKVAELRACGYHAYMVHPIYGSL